MFARTWDSMLTPSDLIRLVSPLGLIARNAYSPLRWLGMNGPRWASVVVVSIQHEEHRRSWRHVYPLLGRGAAASWSPAALADLARAGSHRESGTAPRAGRRSVLASRSLWAGCRGQCRGICRSHHRDFGGGAWEQTARGAGSLW